MEDAVEAVQPPQLSLPNTINGKIDGPAQLLQQASVELHMRPIFPIHSWRKRAENFHKPPLAIAKPDDNGRFAFSGLDGHSYWVEVRSGAIGIRFIVDLDPIKGKTLYPSLASSRWKVPVPQSVLSPNTLSPDIQLEIVRSSCFGPCPAFRVTLNSRGRVTFEPRRHTALGEAASLFITSHDQDEVDELLARLHEFPTYGQVMHTDAPSLRIRYRHDGQIWEYIEQGSDARAPREVAALGYRLVLVLGIADWIR